MVGRIARCPCPRPCARPGRAAGSRQSGDVKPVGEGVSEMRIDHGPGYRVYFKRQGDTVVVLLAGGDKRTQKTDVETAMRLARSL